jgi:hypothetical protein
VVRRETRNTGDRENGGKRIGSLVVYRSGGTTCAMTKHGGASWGKKRFTSIMLVGCKTRKAGKDCGEAPYSGKRCIWARADLGTAGDKRIITVETDRKYRARYCG